MTEFKKGDRIRLVADLVGGRPRDAFSARAGATATVVDPHSASSYPGYRIGNRTYEDPTDYLEIEWDDTPERGKQENGRYFRERFELVQEN